jgi:hypothetical protein
MCSPELVVITVQRAGCCWRGEWERRPSDSITCESKHLGRIRSLMGECGAARRLRGRVNDDSEGRSGISRDGIAANSIVVLSFVLAIGPSMQSLFMEEPVAMTPFESLGRFRRENRGRISGLRVLSADLENERTKSLQSQSPSSLVVVVVVSTGEFVTGKLRSDKGEKFSAFANP